MKVPYYIFGGLGVDAFFIDKVSAPEDRIYLVTGVCGDEAGEDGGLPPLGFERVVRLLEEGYTRLRVVREPLDYRDVVGAIYNPSTYMRRRQREIAANTLTRMYMSLYEKVFELVGKHAYRLAWHIVELRNGEVYICGRPSKPYTTLYTRDKRFKESFDARLEGV